MPVLISLIAWACLNESHHLWPGAITDNKIAYFIAAEGGIQAVSVGTGERIWLSKQAEWPLELAGDALIAAKRGSTTNAFDIELLDPNSGNLIRKATRIELAPNATAQFTYDEPHVLSVESSLLPDGTVDIKWRYVPDPQIGIPLNPRLAAPDTRSSAGEVLLDSHTGDVRPPTNTVKWDPPPFPPYVGVNRLDRTSRILWPASSVGDLTV